MSKHRQAARIDQNQPEIVKQLRQMGASVQCGMDDILVGWRGKNYWFEIKDPQKTKKKNGEYKAGAIKGTQIKLLHEWQGHYAIVSSFDEILQTLNRKTPVWPDDETRVDIIGANPVEDETV